jgi:hypothetical protein
MSPSQDCPEYCASLFATCELTGRALHTFHVSSVLPNTCPRALFIENPRYPYASVWASVLSMQSVNYRGKGATGSNLEFPDRAMHYTHSRGSMGSTPPCCLAHSHLKPAEDAVTGNSSSCSALPTVFTGLFLTSHTLTID